MIHLPGYKNFEKIHESEKTFILRAIKENIPVIIKTNASNSSGNFEFNQLKYEFEILKSFNHDCIIKPISLEVYGNKAFLILEDIEATSLAHIHEDNLVSPAFNSASNFLNSSFLLAIIQYHSLINSFFFQAFSQCG
jgi:hypothetical protein